jgi:hypothetical protein
VHLNKNGIFQAQLYEGGWKNECVVVVNVEVEKQISALLTIMP